jgi:hypothetical protein
MGKMGYNLGMWVCEELQTQLSQKRARGCILSIRLAVVRSACAKRVLTECPLAWQLLSAYRFKAEGVRHKAASTID